ncbi:FtsW/RodA/SpoVE family cell cycle protein [Alkaliphilus transvaalensis]|uniref:FtsW/RodA/SpoVE family cell cycle protein n=1 Tax=Alkaliphilus transvaalensis TaxID=114628 RepID=UPI001FA7B80A|nr:FtsW/RodA/SpoVE family cell cycle protein [Alkaliphilus transvaalensis]
MNNFINDYIEEVCRQIKYKAIVEDISTEIKGHIDELTEGFIEEGLSEQDAIKKAIEQMGDPIQIGKELNKTHKPVTEWSIIALIGTMVLIGGFSLFSIAKDPASLLNLSHIGRSYIIHLVLGLGVASACYFFDYTKLEKYSLKMFIGTIAFLLIGSGIGRSIAGTQYVVIGGVSFAVISVALPLFIISFAGIAKKWVSGNIKDLFKVAGIAFLAIFISLLSQNSLSIILLLAGGFLIIMIATIFNREFKGNRKQHLLTIFGGCSFILALMTFYIFNSPYRKARLLVFINPGADPQGAGYIGYLIRQIISGANLLGKNENMYFTYQGVTRIALPEVSTDFIFAYIVGAFGWLLGIVTILAIALAILRMVVATKKIKDNYGKHLGVAIIAIFSLQAIANILMNTGMFPTLGLSLPFISYGGTNLIVNMGLIGLFLGIYRRKNIVSFKKQKHSII